MPRTPPCRVRPLRRAPYFRKLRVRFVIFLRIIILKSSFVSKNFVSEGMLCFQGVSVSAVAASERLKGVCHLVDF